MITTLLSPQTGSSELAIGIDRANVCLTTMRAKR